MIHHKPFPDAMPTPRGITAKPDYFNPEAFRVHSHLPPPSFHLAILATNSTRNDTVDYRDAVASSNANIPLAVLKAAIMLALIASTLFGNTLVILSVYRSSRLRIVANSFIVSLAVADLMMAVLVMPFSASQEISGRWFFGQVVCDLFNANDVQFSTASLLHLCCISVDRYIAVTDPFQYATRITRRRACSLLVAAWGAAALVSHVPIHLGWYTKLEFRDRVETDVCSFDVNRVYALISCSVSFWTPAVVIVMAYLKIYREAKKQEDIIYSLTYSVGHCVISMSHVKYLAVKNLDTMQSSDGTGRVGQRTQSRVKVRSERKAAKTLGVILGAFLVCWLPFFTWYVTSSLCAEACSTPPDLVSALFWIGYSNSALNPVIYAFFNRDFRKAFGRILGCSRLDGNAYSGS